MDHSSTDKMDNVDTCRVFLCYRQIDGSRAAQWIYERLQEKIIQIGESDILSKIEIYRDVSAPAISNWRDIHKPSLETSYSIIVICTPGLYADKGKEDWVHREINWWLKNRKSSPIIIDVTGEGERWIPQKIINRWPNIQRIQLDIEEISKNKKSEIETIYQNIEDRIIGGIRYSRNESIFEDYERKKSLVFKLKLLLSISLFILVLSIVLAFFASKNAKEARYNLASSYILQAEKAIGKGGELEALAFAARAVNIDGSQDVVDRFSAVNYWATGRPHEARPFMKKALDQDYDQAFVSLVSPHRLDRIATASRARATFENWLLLTIDTREDAYNEVLSYKNFFSQGERLLRESFRYYADDNYSTINELVRLEAELVRLHMRHKYVSESDNQLYSMSAQNISSIHNRLVDKHGINLLDLSESKKNITLDQVTRLMRPNEVIVDFVRYHGRYAAWVVDSRTDPVRIELGQASEIDKVVSCLEDAVQSDATRPVTSSVDSAQSPAHSSVAPSAVTRSVVMSLADPCRNVDEAGKWFRDVVWSNIETWIHEGAESIYIIPDGLFSTIPFAVVPYGNSGDYLIDKYNISYLSSALDIMNRRNYVIEPRNILAIGGIDYNSMEGSDQSGSTSIREAVGYDIFNMLPGTLEEVRLISRLAGAVPGWQSDTLTAQAATEDAFRQKAPNYGIIHLSTHASASQYLSLLKGIGPESGMDTYLHSLDPSLNAIASLSGANTFAENGLNDGILSALEVYSLDLTNVDLVVIPGCNTAGSPQGSVGLMGLLSSFINAGAASVVGSLYIIMDDTAPPMIQEMYKQLLVEEKHPALALRQAALHMRDSGYGSSHWASFVHYGLIIE
ncbi:MAG: CHAT domain-containing protein [Bacteroidota bacterium]